MPLSPRSRIGAYEVVSKIGEGGMGEVYRARDTELDRDVALKMLPETFAADPERLARFAREAKTLAALNHPNIAAIYGVESGAAGRALVMELVPGSTLDEVIARRFQAPGSRFDIGDVISIATQIAEGLEAAHDAGIIHRDLKPANIKLRDDGVVKLLDFGLARAIDSAASGMADPMSSVTMLSPAATQQGVILGTAGYMSPEQARGRVADKRSDIWAFGVVLCEMLTGRRLFTGDTVTEVIATVIKDAPDLSTLPADTPPHLRALIARCLDRDVKTRLRDIGEARVALSRFKEPVADDSSVRRLPISTSRRRPPVRELLAWTLATMAIIAAAGLRFTGGAPNTHVDTATGPLIRSMIPPPDDHVFDFDVTVGPAVLSPDGRHAAFSARSRDGRIQLWVRALDTSEARPIDGSDGASFPFWSPDSRSIGFYNSSRGRIERVDVAGGAPIPIVRAGFVRGASWGSDGTIAYDSSDEGTHIGVVPVTGGTPRRVVNAGGPRAPWILPGSTHILYFNRQLAEVRVIGIDGSGDTRVVEASSGAIYVNGHLLYVREGALLAQPFDLARRAVSGPPVALARGVQMLLSEQKAVFSASETGLLLYQDGAADSVSALAWFDRNGKRQGVVGEMGAARGVSFSPDEQSAIVGILDVDNRTALWRMNLATGVRNRLTHVAGADDVSSFIAWAPDGRDIAYGARLSGKTVINRMPAAGGQSAALLELSPEIARGGMPRVTAWTKDGSTLLYSSQAIGGIFSLLVNAAGPARTDLDREVVNAQNVQLSPNERWLAYQGGFGGTVNGVFVDTYPDSGHRQQVSDRATLPLWSADGKALYLAIDNQLSVVDVTEADGTIRFGPPRTLMPIIIGRGYSFDVTHDGRILALVTSEGRAARPLTLVQNWLAGVRGK